MFEARALLSGQLYLITKNLVCIYCIIAHDVCRRLQETPVKYGASSATSHKQVIITQPSETAILTGLITLVEGYNYYRISS